MRTASLLAGLSAAAAVAFTATPAHASGLAEGTINDCAWGPATTSGNPLTVGLTGLSSYCPGGPGPEFVNDPVFAFNSLSGTAMSPLIDFTVSSLAGSRCSYRMSNVLFDSHGSWRTYSSYFILAVERPPRRILCPDTWTIDSFTITFW